jgi:squalene-hopene/tetraprenyl-beta-curcumene cyclase
MNQAIEVENTLATPATSPAALARDEFAAKLDFTIDRAQRALIAIQHAEGYWHGALEANAEMNSEFIMFNHFMEDVDLELEARLKKHLLDTQQADGSWSLYAGGPGYLSSTVEAYFALKLAGMRAGDEPMMAARRWILSRGGIANTGTLSRFYLACMGQVPWSATAALPVEFMLAPNWFPVNIYELASWARGTLVPLMVLQATRVTRKIDYRQGALELYIQPLHFTKFHHPRGRRLFSLRNAFNGIDRVLAFYERHSFEPLRHRGLVAAESWILEHQEANGSWGGIQPCYLLSAMALKALGYRNDHPVIRKGYEATRELLWNFGDRTLCMPCVSPNWDTAIAAKALLESGLAPDHPALRKAAQWFFANQIFKRGDWSVKRPNLEPGGWSFQFFNDCYPDVDDVAMILTVLPHVAVDDQLVKERSVKAGANWVMGMQSKDGGFAAFDVDNDSHWLNHVPLADVEAVTDPSCSDLTGRALEMMGTVGYRADHPVARRAIQWLKRNQSVDGGWWGRWGVGYIYGTFSALAGLRAVGIDLKQPWIQRSVAWLKSVQNSDGGWGESPLSDSDPAWHGKGASTASQTAWGVIGLLAGEDPLSESVMRGVAWLTERQADAGNWDETASTGNGFPNHFYLHYQLYSHYFPLIALGRFRSRLAELANR